MSILYLVKANEDLICHCHCEQGVICEPGQLDCPWCGCGWMFSCIKCRKAFTFATAVELDTTWEALAREDLLVWLKEEPDQQAIDEWVENMKGMTEHLELGRTYVYFDGYVLPVDLTFFRLQGIKTRHQLDKIPQISAMEDPEFLQNVLSNPDYWSEEQFEPTDLH